MRTRTSVRIPSFFGPFALAAGLLTVILFSEPFWQNFYIINAQSANTTMKIGAWGACSRLRNTTGVMGPATWCTSKMSGFEFNFVTNSTAGGINQFPTNTTDDNTILGLNGDPSLTVSILSSGNTSIFWLHVIAALLTVLTVASLATPPSYLGPETSALHRFQKSGMFTLVLGVLACIIAFVTFCVDLAVLIPAVKRLNAVDGISASLGNIQWYALPSSILMLVAIVSVSMTAQANEYADL